ncbi:MAG TPA: TetR/AcrR family transcriptional regulator [Bryobacteraceae bacterium]
MSSDAAKSARERILDTAEELFYQEGIRAIGIDTVIERSGVAKMSLYRNFASKEELIAAFLARRNEKYWRWWDGIMARHPESPARQLEDLFAALPERICRPGYRGCSFLNAATEFPDAGHLGRRAALEHYEELRKRLLALCRGIKAPRPKQLANQLLLLIEGAYTAGGILEYQDAAKSVVEASTHLIRAHCAAR